MNPLQLNWKKRIIVKLWMIWDQFVLKILHIEPLGQDNSLLKVRLRRYNGRTISLSNGEKIQRGDHVVELHLNNDYLFRLGVHAHSTVQLSIQLIRSMEEMLPKISEYISHHPYKDKITGIYGVSVIHRGAKQFGFTTMELPKGFSSFLVTKYLHLLFICVHPEGKKGVENKRNSLIPKLIAMSKNELLKRYPIKLGSVHGNLIEETKSIIECKPSYMSKTW